MQAAQQQKEFHVCADERRYWNRLRNPFLRPKELKLAGRIANVLPANAAAILEIGCGEGGNLAYLREHAAGHWLCGLDFSPGKLRFMAAQLPGTAVCGDALHLPFRDGVFDLVFMRDLLHHVDWDRERALTEGLRVLKPGGTLMVLESDGRSLLNRAFQFCYATERASRNSTPAKLLALARLHGDPQLEYVEASFLIRALGFFLGWPRGWRRFAVAPVYGLAAAWEWLFASLAPRRAWTYMLLHLRRN